MALQVGWYGYGGNSPLAEALRPTITDLGMSLCTIHEWENADIQWNRDTWLTHLKKADIIIVPANWQTQPAKSNNRLTQALSLGKPVICSPLPAYKKVAERHPDSFLFADTPEEWKAQLLVLRDNEEVRQRLSMKAQEAAKDYSIDVIAGKWLDLFQDKQKVDIVIPTYNNLRGLKLCLDSIRTCTDVLHNIIVVNSGSDDDLHQYLTLQNDIIYKKLDGRKNFAEAVNAGIAAGSAKYICVLNDDVVVTHGWLTGLVASCQNGVGIVGPLSNCDKGWLHNYDINVAGVDLLPGSNTFEQIEPIIKDIHSYRSPYQEVVEREWVAYYCTLILREAYEKAGKLNDEFTNSGEDVDHCRRIRKQGYRIVQNFSSFVFHFGAVSRRGLEQEDPGSYHEADKSTNAHLHLLWDRPSVMIYSGPSYERWDYRNAEVGGVGGSEIWQIMLSREFNRMGYHVVSFADVPENSNDDGVEWRHFSEYDSMVDRHWYDYAILSRTTDPLKFPLRAGKIFVLSHDIWLLSQKDQVFLDRVNKFLCLSEWHRDFFSDYHKIPKDRIALSSNGIDFQRFDSITDVERNPYRFHYSSSWDRGLDNLLYLWPLIRDHIPEAELHVYYGSHTWKAACLQRGDIQGLAKIDEIEKGMQQPGIYSHGRVGQRELATELKKASVLLYPQWFSESFFIGGIEAQYAGVPVICNKYAGVTTTLGESAILLGNGDAWWPYSKEGREAFLQETATLLTHKDKWQHWSEKGKANASKYSWGNVALSWVKLFDA